MKPEIRIPLSEPSLDWHESLAAVRSIKSGWISGKGNFVNEFEYRFAEYTNSKFAIAVSNGTSAIHLALSSLGIGPGDEVIIPAFGFVAFANAVLYVGASPVFIDVEDKNWCIDSNQLKAKITRFTKAVIAVHNYGSLGNIQDIADICKSHNIALIEDCAEALGGSHLGMPAGSFGKIATYSFYGNKIITCGEGGAITTNSPEIAETIRLLRGQGMDPRRKYYFPVMGFNYRLSNLSASVLVTQLKKLPKFLIDRWRVFSDYNERLKTCDFVKIQADISSPWLFTVLLPNHEVLVSLEKDLFSLGIESRPCFYPLPKLPAFKTFNKELYPVTESISRRGISLPTFPRLSSGQIDLITRTVIRNVNIG